LTRERDVKERSVRRKRWRPKELTRLWDVKRKGFPEEKQISRERDAKKVDIEVTFRSYRLSLVFSRCPTSWKLPRPGLPGLYSCGI
jgi:hypothetical protein